MITRMLETIEMWFSMPWRTCTYAHLTFLCFSLPHFTFNVNRLICNRFGHITTWLLSSSINWCAYSAKYHQRLRYHRYLWTTSERRRNSDLRDRFKMYQHHPGIPFFEQYSNLTKETVQQTNGDQQEKRKSRDFGAWCMHQSTFKVCNIICARTRVTRPSHSSPNLTISNVTPNGICVDVLNNKTQTFH